MCSHQNILEAHEQDVCSFEVSLDSLLHKMVLNHPDNSSTFTLPKANETFHTYIEPRGQYIEYFSTPCSELRNDRLNDVTLLHTAFKSLLVSIKFFHADAWES